MSDGTPVTLEELNELLAPLVARLGATPNGGEVITAAHGAAQGIESQGQSGNGLGNRILSFEDQMVLREGLRKRSPGELMQLFRRQAGQRGQGIPLDVWLATGGQARQDLWGNNISQAVDPDIQKLLDTGGGAPLIRQDLEPVLYEMFVREFPAWDRFAKEPANGLTHTFQRNLTFGDAVFMPELGTVTDDASTYERATTNIAIIATRRGVSLKTQFATLQSGSGFNPQDLEMTNGLRAIAHRLQVQIFSGHATDSGGLAANELGLYDANAFTGLRSILNTSTAKNMAFLATPSAVIDPFRKAVNDAAVEIMQVSPGRPAILYMSPLDKAKYDSSQDKNVRYVGNLKNVAPGVDTNAVNTVFGDIPLYPVPGDSIGSYTTTVGGSHAVRDAYLLDESSISMPYLGSEGLSILEIPTGVSGQLTKLFIIFGMYGLAVKAPSYSNKLRIATTDA